MEGVWIGEVWMGEVWEGGADGAVRMGRCVWGGVGGGRWVGVCTGAARHLLRVAHRRNTNLLLLPRAVAPERLLVPPHRVEHASREAEVRLRHARAHRLGPLRAPLGVQARPDGGEESADRFRQRGEEERGRRRNGPASHAVERGDSARGGELRNALRLQLRQERAAQTTE